MTLLDIPPLSTNVYHDGTPILPGDVAVPVLLVVDANNKIAMVRGSPITVRDLEAPVIAGVSTAQAPSGYSFAPAAGTVADFTSGDVKVYHVLLLAGQAAMTAAQLAALVAASAPGDFGEATLSPNVPGQNVLLSELGALAVSRVYAGTGPGFRAVREGDTVVSYVLAVDDSQLKSAAAAPPLAVDDRTPPSGLDQVTLGAPAATTIPVQNLDKITDGGDGVQSLSLFYGTSSSFASAAPVPGNPIPPTATYNIAGLDDATVYNVWVAATDGKNAAAPVAVGSARTLDATDPMISAFDVSQGASGYTFTANAGTVVDNADGPLKAYLVMCASPQTTEQLEAIGKASVQTSAKNEAVSYAANASASVSAMGLSTSQYWTGSAFASISDSAPAAPHQLWAHLLVIDAAGNAGSSQNAGAIKTVVDRTAPTIASFAVQQNRALDSVAAEPMHEFIAARPDTLDPRITFTRASVATRVNSAGLVETVPADAPRFDHDPVTLERRGLLIEEARTNTVLHSESIGLTGWLLFNSTITANAGRSPSGSNNAYKLVANTTNNVDHIARQNVPMVATKTYTFSCFIKAAGQSFCRIKLRNGGNFAEVNTDLTQGNTISAKSGWDVKSVYSTAFSDGWFRCVITFVASSLTGSTADIDVAGAPTLGTITYAGDNASGILVWGAQLEEGAFATSYIPTTTAATTRAGDFPLISGSNLSSWYNATEGTFGIQIETIYSVSDTARHFLSANNNNQIFYMQPTTGTVTSFDGQSSLSSSTKVAGQVSRAFLGYSSGGRFLSARGRSAVTSSSFANFSSLNTLHIGYLGSSGVQFCGWVKSLVYYPTQIAIPSLAASSADDYTFSLKGTGTLVDGRAGPLKTYMVLASGAAMDNTALGAFVTARKADADFGTAKDEALAYTTPGTSITFPYLFTDKFWDATANKWSRITETAPALTAHLAVYDLANNIQSATVANVPIADKTSPKITGFAVAQGASDYTFTVASDARVTDAKAGNLKVYLVLASSASLSNAQLAATFAALPGPAKQEAFTEAMRAAAPALSSSVFWNGSAFVSISESVPASPHSLTAYLVAQDAAGMTMSCAVPRIVADRTAPAFTGTVALTAEGPTSVKAAWSAAFTDAVGITEGRVYYSTTAPANTTASGVTAWKAAATTYYVDVSPLSSLGAAGSATVPALVESTTYHVYVCVKDAAGNELNVATTPASIATPASAPVISTFTIPNQVDTPLTLSQYIQTYYPFDNGSTENWLLESGTGFLTNNNSYAFNLRSKPVQIFDFIEIEMSYKISSLGSANNKRDEIGIRMLDSQAGKATWYINYETARATYATLYRPSLSPVENQEVVYTPEFASQCTNWHRIKIHISASGLATYTAVRESTGVEVARTSVQSANILSNVAASFVFLGSEGPPSVPRSIKNVSVKTGNPPRPVPNQAIVASSVWSGLSPLKYTQNGQVVTVSYRFTKTQLLGGSATSYYWILASTSQLFMGTDTVQPGNPGGDSNWQYSDTGVPDWMRMNVIHHAYAKGLRFADNLFYPGFSSLGAPLATDDSFWINLKRIRVVDNQIWVQYYIPANLLSGGTQQTYTDSTATPLSGSFYMPIAEETGFRSFSGPLGPGSGGYTVIQPGQTYADDTTVKRQRVLDGIAASGMTWV